MAVVTIARQVGSGGEQIAAEVARQLGARLLDDELLELASDGTGIPIRYFQQLDERGRSMLRNPGDLFRLVPLPPINPDLPDVYGDRYPPTGPVIARGDGLESPVYWAAEAYAAAMSRTIQSVARAGNVVIVGRGGNEALAGISDALHVLVLANEPVRVRRLADSQGEDLYGALDLVRDSDRRRRAFVRQFYGADWLDPLRYDVIVRTDELSVQRAVEVIVAAAHATSATPAMSTPPASTATGAHPSPMLIAAL